MSDSQPEHDLISNPLGMAGTKIECRDESSSNRAQDYCDDERRDDESRLSRHDAKYDGTDDHAQDEWQVLIPRVQGIASFDDLEPVRRQDNG